MKNWWVPGCTIGYEHTFINGLADFLASLEGGPAFQPNMRAALRTQRVCDAVLEAPSRASGSRFPLKESWNKIPSPADRKAQASMTKEAPSRKCQGSTPMRNSL